MINKRFKSMTLDEFREKYMKANENWDFKAFKIVCQKCSSSDVEYNGKTETEYGYYGEFDVTTMLVIKCHKCGNAHAMQFQDRGYVGT